MAETISLRALSRATLARQRLLARADAATPAAAVAALGGLQAQEARHPFVALWTRIEGFRRDALADALHARDVVRGTSLRGTLHLHAAGDYAWLRPLLQPVLSAGMRALGERARGLEVEPVVAHARTLLASEPRTFEQLRGLLVGAFPGVHERALGFAVRMHLPLVMVPTDDRWAFPAVARFALADDWLGRPLGAPDDPAARERLVLAYLAAFGPASVADLQAWSGLGGLRDLVAGLRDRLVAFRLEGGGRRELLDLPDAPRPGEDADAPVRLLGEFDSLLLAHADRTRVIADAHRPLVTTRNLRVRATFLVDGAVAGTWTLKRTRREATLTLAPFARLRTSDRRALEQEGERLARFAEADAERVTVTLQAPGEGGS